MHKKLVLHTQLFKTYNVAEQIITPASLWN